MEKLIVCNSKYGSSMIYANELARLTNLKISDDLASADYVIYIAPVFAGKIYKIENIIKNIRKDARLLVLAVGVSDINKDHLNKLIDNHKDLLGDLFCQTEFRMLEGRIDYNKLSFVHKQMMKVMISIIKKKDKSERTTRDELLLETNGKVLDLVDFHNLEKIVNLINSLE